MKKLLLMSLMVSIIPLSIFIINSENITKMPNDTVIPNASYMVYVGQVDTGGITFPSKYVTFYTFDGQPIATIEHECCFPVMERKLDKNSPKARPTKYKIIYDKGIPYKRGPGYWIVFYDKNNKRINSWRFDNKNKSVEVLAKENGEVVEKNGSLVWLNYDFSNPNNLKNLVDFPLDLSIVKEEKNGALE